MRERNARVTLGSERDGRTERLRRDLSCIGCGFCCTKVICGIGAMFYGHYTNPCPALELNGNRYVCSLYRRDPDRYEHVLAIGEGCCFPDNPWRSDRGGVP